MAKIAIVREEWPAIAGHGAVTKVYEVKVKREYENIIVGKKHWYSRNEVYVKNGMFVKVEQIIEDK